MFVQSLYNISKKIYKKRKLIFWKLHNSVAKFFLIWITIWTLLNYDYFGTFCSVGKQTESSELLVKWIFFTFR